MKFDSSWNIFGSSAEWIEFYCIHYEQQVMRRLIQRSVPDVMEGQGTLWGGSFRNSLLAHVDASSLAVALCYNIILSESDSN
jgi:hypothetical protein